MVNISQDGDIRIKMLQKQPDVLLIYSASAKGCTQPGCRVQTRGHSHSHDFPPVPRDAMFSRLARV